MWQNYLTSTIRNLRKRAGFTLLNIFGLALGMSCCLFILQYVRYERSYDEFHPNADDIYRLRLDAYQEGRLAWQSATVYPAFAPTIRRDFPEVVNACRLHDAGAVMVNPKTNVKFREKKGYFADPPFLEMFNIRLRAGDTKTALTGPDKMLVSETMARKYFGRTDVLGEHLLIQDAGAPKAYEISGVFSDYPANSHLAIDYLVSYATLQQIINQEWQDTTNATETAWGWYDFYTYLQLQPGTDLATFKAKFPAFMDQYPNKQYIERKINGRNDIDIIPLRDIHLYSNFNQEAEVNGNGRAVAVLFIVAFFILAIAWINYVNLSTARSMERGREVGVRKVLGAERGQLFGQFMTESLVLNILAFLLSLVIVAVLMPAFSELAGKDLSLQFLTTPGFWAGSVGVLAAGSLLAGLYPSFVLAGFRPVSMLRGQLKNSSGGAYLRKGLIVFQFVASIALIAGTLVVYHQIRFMRGQDLGIDIGQTLVLEGAQTPIDSQYMGRFEPFKNEVLGLPAVQNMAASSSVPGDEIYWTNGVTLQGQGSQQPTITLFNLGVDDHFFSTYKLQMKAGRAFSKQFGDDVARKTIVLNETAAKTFGFQRPEDAINRKIIRARDSLVVVGVVGDFHHEGLQKTINPMALLYRPDSRRFYSFKLDSRDGQNTLASIENIWSAHFPNDPFDYFFLDESFNKQYEADIQFGRVFSLFAVLAILVACLGLLGLASYQIVQRTKEIGIRKVLGSSTVGILRLLSGDYVRLILIAFVLATPLAWYAMDRWLDHFAYRISIAWWVFALAGILALLVAIITVSVQSVQAALANPVKALRGE